MPIPGLASKLEQIETYPQQVFDFVGYHLKIQRLGFMSHSTVRSVLGQVLSIATCRLKPTQR